LSRLRVQKGAKSAELWFKNNRSRYSQRKPTLEKQIRKPNKEKPKEASGVPPQTSVTEHLTIKKGRTAGPAIHTALKQ
jgi:hypothetical protein